MTIVLTILLSLSTIIVAVSLRNNYHKPAISSLHVKEYRGIGAKAMIGALVFKVFVFPEILSVSLPIRIAQIRSGTTPL